MRKITPYYWQDSLNGSRHYVASLSWLTDRSEDIRLLHIHPIDPPKKPAKLIAYLDKGILFFAKFSTYDEAKKFVIRTAFDQANKEIQSR